MAALGTSPCPIEDLRWLSFDLPELRQERQDAEHRRSQVLDGHRPAADGKRARGRPMQFTDQEIRDAHAATMRTNRRRLSKALLYDSVRRVLARGEVLGKNPELQTPGPEDLLQDRDPKALIKAIEEAMGTGRLPSDKRIREALRGTRATKRREHSWDELVALYPGLRVSGGLAGENFKHLMLQAYNENPVAFIQQREALPRGRAALQANIKFLEGLVDEARRRGFKPGHHSLKDLMSKLSPAPPTDDPPT